MKDLDSEPVRKKKKVLISILNLILNSFHPFENAKIRIFMQKIYMYICKGDEGLICWNEILPSL